MLSEVAYNRQYEFSEEAKTCLAVTYDLWSCWVHWLEAYLLDLDTGVHIGPGHLSDIIGKASEVCSEFDASIRTAQEDLDVGFILFAIEASEPSLERLKGTLSNGLPEKTASEAMAFSVDTLGSFLQETLFIVQECDFYHLKFGRKEDIPFISLEEGAYDYFLRTGKATFCERLKIYSSRYDLEKIEVKEYLNSPKDLKPALEAIEERTGVAVIHVI
jgi:hypothetical protein